MSIKLTLGALFLFSPSFIGQTSTRQTATTTQQFSSPSQAWEYVNEPRAEWDAAFKASKVPSFSTPFAFEIHRRASKQCLAFALDSVNGEEQYWLAKLCESAAMFPKALSAAERYLTSEGGVHRPEARILLAVLQMQTTKDWEASWQTYRTILQVDPIGPEQEMAVRVAVEEEANKNEATALAWSQEHYSILLKRAGNPKAEAPPVPYEWVFIDGGDLVHRYYLAGDANKAAALLAELNDLKKTHPVDEYSWAADYLHTANMEMNSAPQIPVLKAVGGQPGTDLLQKGRVEVVHFIFLRCPPCITQLKDLDSMQKRFGKKSVLVANVTTYKVALQPDAPAHASVDSALQKIRKKESPHLAMVVAPEKTLADFHVTAFPVLAVIDKEGRLRYEGKSNDFDEGEEIDRLVRKLLAE